MKTCKDCKTPKELSDFPKNGNSFKSRCKTCHSDYKKALKNDKVVKDRAERINKIKIALGGVR